MFVRLGGDEFLILLLHTNMENSSVVAQKILDKVKDYDEKCKFTVSIGISQIQETDNNINEMMKRADISLYKAKNEGKNKFV